MNAVAQERTNVAPTKIPWDLLRILITETYGGKIDDEADFKELSHLVDKILTVAAFDEDHKLVEGPQEPGGDGSLEEDRGLVVPGGTQLPEFMEWVNRLPEREPPTYLGLPANAEKILLVGHGEKTIGNLAKITELLEEGAQLVAEA